MISSQRSTVLRMAHLPTMPDPSPRRNPHGQSPSDSQFSFTELSRLLGKHGAGSSSDDLALDLLLHEVVSQACSATNASGAAIALLRNGEFVCRATSGKNAPDLGSHLSSDSGLSGACIQSREVQRCDDTELDTRVDAVACRRLGVRSVLVVPLLLENAVVGVLETFSPDVHAFTDNDARTLASLSQRIMEMMIRPDEKEEKEEEKAAPAEAFVINAEVLKPRKDPWIAILAILIVALALLLGWMLGHRGLGKNVPRDNSSLEDMDSVKAAAPMREPASPPISVSKPNNQTPAAAITPKAPAKAVGGLAVYEDGKLVFQAKPIVGSNSNSIAVQVPPGAANSLLLERIEPQYPDAARLAHIQGSVVLQVDVNEKGAVEQLRALSGDPQLVTAAVDAVKHWRFKTYAPRGEALNFQTQVTVDFKLP